MATGPSTKPAPRDPVLESLANAPEDDEPLTEEDERAIEEAREEVRRGEVLTHEEVRRLWLEKP
jgi:hypothetical protein